MNEIEDFIKEYKIEHELYDMQFYYDHLCPYTEPKAKNKWMMTIRKWMIATELGLKCRPMIICGDNHDAFMGITMAMQDILRVKRKMLYLALGNENRTLAFDWKIYNIGNDRRESQGNLIIILDWTNPEEDFKLSKPYVGAFDKYKDTKTNVLLFTDFESYEVNKDNPGMIVLTTKPDDGTVIQLPKPKEILEEELVIMSEYIEIKEKQYIRRLPYIIKDKANSKRLFRYLHMYLRQKPFSKYEIPFPSMRKVEVTKSRFNKWMSDQDVLTDELAHFNIAIFDFNILDHTKIDELYERIVKADPSGDCIIVYIIPEDLHLEVKAVTIDM